MTEGEHLMRKRALIIGIASLLLLGMATAAIAQVQVHGFLLARTIMTNTNYSARIDRYGLRILQKVDDEFDLLTEVYIHPSEADARARVYMESAFLNWHLKNRLPWDFNVRIGKGRNLCYGIAPSYANRRTSDYTLYSEAFTQLRVTGFQTFSNFGNAQLAIAIINPYTQSSRQLPDFYLANSNKIDIPICDRDNDTGAIRNRVGISGRLGYKTTLLNVGASGYMSQTGPDKVGGVKQKNAINRFGLDGEVKLENGLMAQGQFTMATTSWDMDKNGVRETELSHNGGEVLVGWENWTTYKAGLYARYGMLTYDDTLQGLNQIMVSGVYKIRPNIHLRLETLINGEQTGSIKKGLNKGQKLSKCKNDVLFFETCFEW
jgi:hypothetical protein